MSCAFLSKPLSGNAGVFLLKQYAIYGLRKVPLEFLSKGILVNSIGDDLVKSHQLDGLSQKAPDARRANLYE